jgi:protocatechuate 3,4-dioxygenase beta subunit
VLLYVYQTNAKGEYPKKGSETGQDKWHGYLRGWLRTDTSGHYLISTIKPGAYPGHTEPAHIHVVAKMRSGPAFYLNDFTFEGDPLLTTAYREKVKQKGDPGIVNLNKSAANMLTGYRDIVLTQ